MSAFSNDLLIDQQTGELDLDYILQQASARARADRDGNDPPLQWIRSHYLELCDRGAILRRRWRAAHGLPDDTKYVTVQMPAWGASGDVF